ncbi:DUF6804 family protein [Acinetobacter soli]|uniref:DUF6804 family protein n=1 Tax=Acinetobacter soli TaxID=487316 RepID=UPI001F3ED333|nr:DUF6804 family protein [Acinetobacter soli]MCE6007444.1 hypothetical protein [Acinetobacter soli]
MGSQTGFDVMIFFKKQYLFYLSATYLLIAATGDNDFDYGFYQLLRFVAFFTFSFAAYVSYSNNQQIMPFILGLIAVVFNPFVPIHFDKDTWQVIDVFAGVLLILWGYFIYFLKGSQKAHDIYQLIKDDPEKSIKEASSLLFFIFCVLLVGYGFLKIIVDVFGDFF